MTVKVRTHHGKFLVSICSRRSKLEFQGRGNKTIVGTIATDMQNSRREAKKRRPEGFCERVYAKELELDLVEIRRNLT